MFVVVDGADQAVAVLLRSNETALNGGEGDDDDEDEEEEEHQQQQQEEDDDDSNEENESRSSNHNGLELCVKFERFPWEEEGPVVCDRFVRAVAQNEQLETLYFWCGTFHRSNTNNASAMDRLFGQVIPRHASLQKLRLEYCDISSEYIEMLTNALAQTNETPRGAFKSSEDADHLSQQQQGAGGGLKHIVMRKTSLDSRTVLALANLLRPAAAAADSAALQIHSLELDDCGVDSEGCQAILQALDGNTSLRRLDLRYNNISTLHTTGIRALANSNLQSLILNDNPLTEEGVHEALAIGLRTNWTLEDLDLSHFQSELSASLFEELLIRFNFTLQTFRIDEGVDDDEDATAQPRIQHLLLRNRHVRDAHNQLQSSLHNKNYHVAKACLWPRTLERISSKPSLLYKFIRQGNLDAFTDRLAGPTSPSPSSSTMTK